MNIICFRCWRAGGPATEIIDVPAASAQRAASECAEHLNNDSSYGIVSPLHGDGVEIVTRDPFGEERRFMVRTVKRYDATPIAPATSAESTRQSGGSA